MTKKEAEAKVRAFAESRVMGYLYTSYNEEPCIDSFGVGKEEVTQEDIDAMFSSILDSLNRHFAARS